MRFTLQCAGSTSRLFRRTFRRYEFRESIEAITRTSDAPAPLISSPALIASMDSRIVTKTKSSCGRAIPDFLPFPCPRKKRPGRESDVRARVHLTLILFRPCQLRLGYLRHDRIVDGVAWALRTLRLMMIELLSFQTGAYLHGE